MTLLTTLVASQALVFPGGSSHHITNTLSKWSNGVAVTLLDDRGLYRPFKVDAKAASNSKDVIRLALRRGDVKLSISPQGVGASRGIYSMEIREQYPTIEAWLSKRGQHTETIPDNAFRNRKVNLVTGADGGINLRQFSQHPLGKPLRMHWMFERMTVAIHAKEVDQTPFFHVLASAIGAKWVETKDEYRLDLNPVAVREFAARTVESSPEDTHEPAAFRPYRQLSKRLAALAWREASLEEVSRAFKTPNGVYGYRPSRSKILLSLIRRKIDFMIALSGDSERNVPNRNKLDTLVGAADLNGTPSIILGPDLSVGVALPAKSGGTVIL